MAEESGQNIGGGKELDIIFVGSDDDEASEHNETDKEEDDDSSSLSSLNEVGMYDLH